MGLLHSLQPADLDQHQHTHCCHPYPLMHMQGTGASPEGNRPFLDLLDLDTRETRRLWQSSAPYYSQPGAIFNDRDYVRQWNLPGCASPTTLEGTY
jgi:hypothetical protein